jgi:catechol 2,3-dioxygenase-like lactoylglutathione lyase family enzyme
VSAAPDVPGISAISLFVDDVQRAKAWYQHVFDVLVVFEDEVSAVVQFDNTIVNLLARTEAPGLVAPAPVAASGAGAQLQFTIWVGDANDTVAQLRARGVTLLNGPIDRPWGQRTACFADPDGFVWEIAQTLS